MMRPWILSLVLVAAASCRVAVKPLEGFDVVLQPTVRCTQTGASTRDCTDRAVLALERTEGRWIIEHSSSQSFILTTELGSTIPGIYFDDDSFVLDEPPCEGEGGLCYFARRRFESTDLDDGCTKSGEIVAILRRAEEGTFTGLISNVQGQNEDCGTPSETQDVDEVTATLAPDAALSRVEAAE